MIRCWFVALVFGLLVHPVHAEVFSDSIPLSGIDSVGSQQTVRIVIDIRDTVTVKGVIFGLQGKPGILWVQEPGREWMVVYTMVLQGITAARIEADTAEAWVHGLKWPSDGVSDAKQAWAVFRPHPNGYNHATQYFFGMEPPSYRSFSRR